jgi:hypothetical protein
MLNLLEKLLAQIEWLRVRNHLRIVEQELQRENVEHLSEELQQERAKNISRLHQYWTSGLYPKNTEVLYKRVPYFKDAIGTPCAMAYLIEQSGHQNLVNEVARTDNHVYINDIDNGPVLEWINESGLTKAEAARVQPTYACGTSIWADPCPDPLVQSFSALLPWIVGGIGFVVLEWLSYKIVSWLALDDRKRRLAVWSYFTIGNLLFALIVGGLVAAWVFASTFDPFTIYP